MSAVPAIKAYLEGLGLTVFDGPPPKEPPTHYVCLYSHDYRTELRMSMKAGLSVEKVRARSVAASMMQLRWVRDRVMTLPGRRIGGNVITHDFPSEVDVEDSTPQTIVSTIDQFNVPAPVPQEA